MMKLKGKFEKQQLEVGLSSDVPITYDGPEQKYQLADALVARSGTAHLRYEKRSVEFELEVTSDELVRTPERLRCYRIISAMPEQALPEVEDELRETYEHYLSIARVEDSPNLLTAGQEVQATVTETLRT